MNIRFLKISIPPLIRQISKEIIAKHQIILVQNLICSHNQKIKDKH